MRPSTRPITVDLASPAATEPWLLAQAAAVAAAEAIAATAAADVAAEAAGTAQAAVDVASAAAAKAATKAGVVAAQAVLAAAAAAAEMPHPATAWEGTRDDPSARPLVEGSRLPRKARLGAAAGHEAVADAATAAADVAAAVAKVASSVAAVAAAAAHAAVEAATLIREQLAKDVAVMALDVVIAGSDGAAASPAAAVVNARGAVAQDLQYGISAGQLRLHYQPIMNVATGQPIGVEALVRWQHPERGLLGPAEFIQVAEETGLVLPMGAWVLQEACRMAVGLQRRGSVPFTVSVNLSRRQLSDRGLVDALRTALDANGCGAELLVLEVTETALVTDMTAAIDSLRELQSLGAGVAIDDFGTGYAPLLYLKHLAADELKIDRSFISGLGVDCYDMAMIASLILLAHNLDVQCVAEGVETAEQVTLLKELGCDYAQGYLFSRPLDAAALDTWLNRHLTVGAVSPAVVATKIADAVADGPPTSHMSAMQRGGASLSTIAASLNADGSRTAQGRRWAAKSVAKALGGPDAARPSRRGQWPA